MTVKRLIEELSLLDPNRKVLCASDSEGNSYSEVAGVFETGFIRDGYEIEIGLEELTDELINEGYDDEDVLEDCERGVVIYV